MTSIKILGTGRYVPERVVTNDDFAAFLDTSDEWIAARTGMKARHIAVDEPTWLMGAKASELAMNAAGIRPEEIGLVIASTCTSDFYTPSAASLIQRELGIENAFSFDVNAACTGFVFVLDMARRYIATGDAGKILIAGAETLTQFLDYTDRASCILFGDGAGACVVEGTDGIYGTYQNCDITGTQHVYGQRTRRSTPFGEAAAQSPFDPFPIGKPGSIVMNGREVYKFASKAMPEAIEKACENAGVTVSDLAIIIPHQANLRIIQTAAKNMDIDMERIYVNIQEYSNTSSATIPIGLDECVRGGRIKPGDLVCLVGFGAGLTYGALVFRY